MSWGWICYIYYWMKKTHFLCRISDGENDSLVGFNHSAASRSRWWVVEENVLKFWVWHTRTAQAFSSYYRKYLSCGDPPPPPASQASRERESQRDAKHGRYWKRPGVWCHRPKTIFPFVQLIGLSVCFLSFRETEW